MECLNRKIFYKIVLKETIKKLTALTLGILMPIFLFAPATQAISTEPIAAVFSLRNNEDREALDARYNLESKHLFGTVYKAKVPAQSFEPFKNDPQLVYAEKDGTVSVSELTVTQLVVTDDPFFTTDAAAENKQWYLPKVSIPEAWNYSKGSSNVTVAVIDTGIHASHMELNDGRVIEGYDIIKNQAIFPNSNSDDNGHGTAVAGVIGAIPNNHIGLAGVNWNVKLMPVKTLTAEGTGEISDLAAGIVWAADHGANIINLSLGGPGYGADMTLSNAITYAYEKGVLIVAAAGNDLALNGQNLDATPVYPVCGDNGRNMILGVAATDINDTKAGFSNFGASCVDISAPGKKILTTAYLPSDPSNNILIYGSGTSLATPIVSGIAALIKAQNVNLSNTDIRNIILKTADDIYPVNQTSCLGGSCNGFLGKGRINAAAALRPIPITEGALIRDNITGYIYIVSNKMKRLVSQFVFTQRGFAADAVTNDNGQLATLAEGIPLPPLDGTLIKAQTDPTVFVIHQEMKRPLTYLVFVSRNYSFANVNNLPDSEVLSYPTGDWYWPPDGTLVLITGNPLVYVMDQQVARPTTYFVFTQRGLSFKKVIAVTEDEFSHVPRPPDAYWLAPLEGTLVKSPEDPGIYVIESGMKRLLSFESFVSRGYNFRNVKTLPQVEMDVIAPGPVLQ